MINVRFKRLHEDAIIPKFETTGSAGMDVRSVESILIPPGETKLVKLGFAVEIPPGYEIQIRPRSGLALKHSITIPNSPGTVDSDYRGEMMVILHNFGDKNFQVRKGERIAQAVLSSVPVWAFAMYPDLTDTLRGEGGFGSTGSN